MVSFYRYLFRRLLCSLGEIEDPCAAARVAVGSADRLLAVYLVQFVRLAAKRLVGKSRQLRKTYAGLLLSNIKHAKSIQLEAKSDFGRGCHTRSTEPYFYEAAYLHSKGFLISVNGEGKCVLARAHPEGDSATDAGTNIVSRAIRILRVRVGGGRAQGQGGGGKIRMVYLYRFLCVSAGMLAAPIRLQQA